MLAINSVFDFEPETAEYRLWESSWSHPWARLCFVCFPVFVTTNISCFRSTYSAKLRPH